jgi:hypothetical protein
MRIAKIEVVDYRERAYLNRVARTLIRSSRNFQVEELETEEYHKMYATKLEVTNYGKTTFGPRDWELELKAIFGKTDNLKNGIIYLNVDGELISLNDFTYCKMCKEGEATHPGVNSKQELCSECYGTVNC